MKATNEMKLSFKSKSTNESFARTAVASFLLQLDPTISEMADIKTAVSEAVTNCIIHAYKDNLGIIYITTQIFESRKVIIKIKDKGCGIKNIEQAMQPMYTTGGEERAGLGFAVMQSFTDKLKVISTPDKGTTITLIKTLGTYDE